jgi:RNA polymerase sigma factor (sigma-70 family)
LVSQKTKSEERALKNYKDSDYALNKYSAGIVYRFADGSKATYTLADFLAENPGKAEDDFRALKEISDGIYLNQVTAENAQTKKNTSLDKLSGSKRYTPSPEDLHISAINAREEAERHEIQTELSRAALDRLTDKQRRRYLLYHADGKTEEQIAELEGATHQAVSKSLLSADKKIKKFLPAD